MLKEGQPSSVIFSFSCLTKRNIRKKKIEEYSANTWPVIPRTVQVFKNKGSLTNFHSLLELKKYYD